MSNQVAIDLSYILNSKITDVNARYKKEPAFSLRVLGNLSLQHALYGRNNDIKFKITVKHNAKSVDIEKIFILGFIHFGIPKSAYRVVFHQSLAGHTYNINEFLSLKNFVTFNRETSTVTVDNQLFINVTRNIVIIDNPLISQWELILDGNVIYHKNYSSDFSYDCSYPRNYRLNTEVIERFVSIDEEGELHICDGPENSFFKIGPMPKTKYNSFITKHKEMFGNKFHNTALII